MKLHKVKKILNVGLFNDHDDSSLEFSDLNLIYANNASGKSTLSDIFKDLSDCDSNRIISRKTIQSNGPQVIKLAYKSNKNTKEKDIVFSNNEWNSDIFKDKIVAFDTEFIQNNVFNGINLLDSTDTRYNFSGFILGDEGVRLAKERENINKELTEAREKLRNQKPNSQKKIEATDLQTKRYIEKIKRYDEEELLSKKTNLEKVIKEEETLYSNKEYIVNLKNIPNISEKNIEDIIDVIELSKNILLKTYSIQTNDWESLERHINKHFHNEDEGRKWIEKGVSLSKNQKSCPFCSQSLDNNDIHKFYEIIFDESYKKYSVEVKDEINKVKEKINLLDITVETSKILILFDEANKLLGEKIIGFHEELKHDIDELNHFNKEKNLSLKKELNNLRLALKIKKSLSNESIAFDFKKIDILVSEAKNKIHKLNSTIDKINIEINTFKNKVKLDKSNDSDKKRKSLEVINNKLTQIEETRDGDKWLTQYKRVQELKKLREEKERELEYTQEEYLDNYFNEINDIFYKYGGYDYRLERGSINKRYNRPVIGVRLLFKGIDVTELDSSKFFSESDSRALALSIFMAKLNSIDSKELSEKIIVFDDPVTSFDEDRMTLVAKSIIHLTDKVKQIIILSHQYNFSKKIYDSYSGSRYYNMDKPISYFMIENRSGSASKITHLNETEFFNHEFLKQYKRISDFALGKEDGVSGNDLRTFLEEYLRLSFPKIYSEKFSQGYVPLNKIIEELEKEKYISSNIKEEIIIKKEPLNSYSHQFNSMTERELRIFSKNLLKYLDETFRLS